MEGGPVGSEGSRRRTFGKEVGLLLMQVFGISLRFIFRLVFFFVCVSVSTCSNGFIMFHSIVLLQWNYMFLELQCLFDGSCNVAVLDGFLLVSS